MDKIFIKKMMQAKKLEYEAIKEIMPEKVKVRINSFEKEAFDLLKDIAIEIIKDEADEKSDTDNKTDNPKKRTKKVSVDFN